MTTARNVIFRKMEENVANKGFRDWNDDKLLDSREWDKKKKEEDKRVWQAEIKSTEFELQLVFPSVIAQSLSGKASGGLTDALWSALHKLTIITPC